VMALEDTILTETREEVARADSKASLLFSTVLVVVGVVAAAMLAGDWSPNRLRTWAQVLWWAGAAGVGGGIVLLGGAVYPRVLNRSEGPGATYFNEIAKLKSIQVLDDALTAMTEKARTLKQLYALSHIAHRKFALIAWAIRLFGVALTLIVIAVIAGRH
jgi:hypothetical protein